MKLCRFETFPDVLSSVGFKDVKGFSDLVAFLLNKFKKFKYVGQKTHYGIAYSNSPGFVGWSEDTAEIRVRNMMATLRRYVQDEDEEFLVSLNKQLTPLGISIHGFDKKSQSITFAKS